MGLFPFPLTGSFFLFSILIFIYFLKYETIVKRRARCFVIQIQIQIQQCSVRYVYGTGNVNGMQIFTCNSKGILPQMSTKGRQVVNNGQNLVNVVKERSQSQIFNLSLVGLKRTKFSAENHVSKYRKQQILQNYVHTVLLKSLINEQTLTNEHAYF